MKVKEIDRTANIAWSPQPQHPIYVAAGTAAQQLDATFSTSAALEIYKLNLSEPSLGMEPVGSLSSDYRFHKLVWGKEGMENDSTESGVLVGGCENGKLFMWDPAKLIKGEDALIAQLEKHSGAVAALDFNPFQNNLLASGGTDSEIFLWDMNNLSSPMTPGAKSQPPDDVSCVAWNRQVQHILASTFTSRCVVWDLRKNDPIIKISDSMARIKSKLVAWHPEVATQMCLASEDDHTPVIQLWDLRFATSPLKVLENHQRGILSMAWCPQDPDLLLSCAKDNRILCWNPNSNVQGGEVIYELPTSHQWSFDVQWCPRNPAILSSSAFDGHISIYSVMGGVEAPVSPMDKIADSFTDAFGQPIAHQQQSPVAAARMPLQKPPKWLRRPVGARFSFGGKLISFTHEKPQAHAQQPAPKLVHISQVVTETDLVARSSQLENALNNGQYNEFCALKIANSSNEMEESIWKFMKVNFENDPRNLFLQLLGFDKTDLDKKVAVATAGINDEAPGVDATELTEKMSALSSGGQGLSSSVQGSPRVGTPELLGESAEGAAAFDKIAATGTDSRPDSPFPISTENDIDGLISQAVLTGNFEAAVELCIKDGRMAEAIILAIADSPELLLRTQTRFFKQNKCNITRLISSVVQKDWSSIVEMCEIDNWKEALAIILTYAKPEDFSALCDTLGSRLESERRGELGVNAILCYICAGNIEKLVECWARNTPNNSSPAALQDLVEKVMMLRKAVETVQGQAFELSGNSIADKLSHYAELLAAQGSLATAMSYLGNSNEEKLVLLRYRLYQALGSDASPYLKPTCPFEKQEVPATAKVQPRQQTQHQPKQVAKPYHQAQAVSSFQTATTSSATYYNPNQFTSYNGPANTTPTYSQDTSQYDYGQTSQAAQPMPMSRGPLSHKYPASASSAYGLDSYSQQPSQPTQYSQPGYTPAPYSGYGQPTSQPTPANIYNPAVVQPQPIQQPTPDSHIFRPPPLFRRRSSKHLDREFLGDIGTGHENQSPLNSPRDSMKTVKETRSSNRVDGLPTENDEGTSSSHEPSYIDNKPETAWNDPPIVTNKKKPKASYQPPAPITAPIFGVPQPAEQTPPGAPYGQQQQFYNPQDHQPMQQQQQPQQQQRQQAPSAAPEPPQPKAPIPAENQVIQDILDILVKKCLTMASNAQAKRKLEDVTRRLETLYDKLRAYQLSDNVILGLHQIIQAIQQYDYQAVLTIHTQMISQGNFSEISSFMPGIKVLIQTAYQMQVYVQ